LSTILFGGKSFEFVNMEPIGLADISLYAIYVPLVIGLFCAQYYTRDLKIFVGFLAAGAITEVAGRFFAAHYGNNIWLLNIYFGVEYVLIALCVSYWHHPPWKMYIRRSIPVFILVYGLTLYGNGDITTLNTMGKFLQSGLVMILAIITLSKLFLHPTEKIFSTYPFWITIGILLYFAGTSFVWLFGSIIFANNLFDHWSIHSILNISAYILYSIGLVWARWNPKSGGI